MRPERSCLHRQAVRLASLSATVRQLERADGDAGNSLWHLRSGLPLRLRRTGPGVRHPALPASSPTLVSDCRKITDRIKVKNLYKSRSRKTYLWAVNGADCEPRSEQSSSLIRICLVPFPHLTDSSLRASLLFGGKMGRRRFELRLRPPEGRRMPSYPTGPHSRADER